MNSSLYDSYKTLRVFEAFAGYGSQSIALRNLGVKHEVVAISEIDKYALKAYYSLHSKDIPNLGDISKLKVEDMPQHDLFTYSFPCQDISVAGKQAGIEKGQTRSGLLYECERIIEHCKPKYLLMENVKNLVGKKFKTQFDEWLGYLEELGYTNYWKVLNAKDYGVPQNRERVFCISILGEHEPYKFPQPVKLNRAIKDILEDEVEEKYYLSDERLMKIYNWKAYQRPPERVLGKKSICPTLTARGAGEWHSGMIALSDDFEGTTNVDKIICEQRSDEGLRFFKKDVCGTIRTKDSGGDKRVIEGSQVTRQDLCRVERMPLKFLNRNGKQTGEDYAFCVDTCHTGGIKEVYENNDFRIRKLTPRECFRLMGMNDCDIDKIQQTGISNSQQYKLAGNSIVVNVLEAIFRNLFVGKDEHQTPSE